MSYHIHTCMHQIQPHVGHHWLLEPSKSYQFAKSFPFIFWVKIFSLQKLKTNVRENGNNKLHTAVQGLRFSCYSWAPEPRHPVHVTDVYATESRTPLVRELSADRFSVGLLLHCSPPSRVRAGEWAKVCGGQAPLWSAASAEKQRIFFLFRLQPTRHRYSLTHSTAHMNSCQSTKWHQTQ